MPSPQHNNYVIFEYLYRDADNYKAYGELLLVGNDSQTSSSAIQEACESGELFVAEQIGIPPLYNGLYQWSGGATAADHGFHEFVELRAASAGDADLPLAGSLENLVNRFQGAAGNWSLALSPHG